MPAVPVDTKTRSLVMAVIERAVIRINNRTSLLRINDEEIPSLRRLIIMSGIINFHFSADKMASDTRAVRARKYNERRDFLFVARAQLNLGRDPRERWRICCCGRKWPWIITVFAAFVLHCRGIKQASVSKFFPPLKTFDSRRRGFSLL